MQSKGEKRRHHHELYTALHVRNDNTDIETAIGITPEL
jgi:hypothetical protein